MRESVIDVLFYLFDDLLSDEEVLRADVDEMACQLSEAGFAQEDVGRAVDWFIELSKLHQYCPEEQRSSAVRIFSTQENQFIDQEGQDYLRGLMRQGEISADVMEKIIDCALALEEPLDIHVLRWVSAMVLLNVYGEVNESVVLGVDDALIWPSTVH